jgi:O-antigen/teichoic acid export membrane protein
MQRVQAVRKGASFPVLALSILAHARPALWSWSWVVIAGAVLATTVLLCLLVKRKEGARRGTFRRGVDAALSLVLLATALATLLLGGVWLDAAIIASVALACSSFL